MIQPLPIERLPRQSQPFSELQVIVEKEHKKLLARKVLIERRKEEQERQMLEMVCWSLLLHYHIWFLSFHFRWCRFSAHFSLLACLRNLNHLGQMSWLCHVAVGKGRGVKEIEAATTDRRGWGQEACKWVCQAWGGQDSEGDWRKRAWGSKSSACRSWEAEGKKGEEGCRRWSEFCVWTVQLLMDAQDFGMFA